MVDFQSVLYGFVLPFFLFFLIIFALLRRTKIFGEYNIEFGISFIIAFLGTYWLYNNNLSQVLISSTGILIVVLFVAAIILSIAYKSYSKVKEEELEAKKRIQKARQELQQIQENKKNNK
ncbi:MAG: hypothetical protein QW197_00260 [Candidatus Aenigmatarchaeota archaeon]